MSSIMGRRRALLVVLAVVATMAPLGAAPAAAAPVRYLDPVFSGVTVTKDLVFGAARDFDGRIQQLDLDLYQPTGDGLAKRPVIVLAFGGGFWFGTKEQLAGQATAYAKRGFVVASITYRLDEEAGPLRNPFDASGQARIRAAQHDMQAAVRWLRSQAITYRLDPGKVAVGGLSAGAITSATVAMRPDDPGASGTPGLSSAVCTAVVISGGANGALAGPGDAGAIFFQGTADPIVPHAWAQSTETSMRNAGLPTSFVSYPGGGHDVFATQADDIEERSSAWVKTQAVDRATSCAGPIDPAADSFATAAHHDFLDRAPTADELARMVNLLDSGASRGLVLNGLTSSDEWLGAIVAGFYADTLGREPDAEGLAFWVEALRTGRFTVAEVAASFYAAPEFRDGTVEAWITDLYEAILGRAAAPEDVVYWAEQVEVHGPSWVAVRLYGSLESREDRVTARYEHLLARAPEADGLAYWADRIATAGDLALARNLAASTEYRTRAIARFP
jgi:acetyl esterase/lipase